MAKLTYSFFFALAPPEQFDTNGTPYRTRVSDQEAFFNSLQSPATFTHATPFSSWNTLHGSYGPQEPLTPGPSCSASDIMTGFTLDDPFCSAQSMRGLHGDRGMQPRLSPENDRAPWGDSRQRLDTPDLPQGRVRHVMEQAAAVGFETLDEAVAAYYTETFEDMPSLYQEQRLSRNRRLPRLLNTLHSAAKGWSEWERRGFQEQITLGAEEVLVQELNTYITQQRMSADGNRSASGDMGEARVEHTEDALRRRRKVQNDVSANLNPARACPSHIDCYQPQPTGHG